MARSCEGLSHYDRARELQREVVEAKKRTFGAQHNKTKRAEKDLERVEAAMMDKHTEPDAIKWLTKGRGVVLRGRGRGPTRSSRGDHGYSKKRSNHSYKNSVARSRSGSIVSMPPFMSNEHIKPVTSPGIQRHSRSPSPSNPEFQNAQNEVNRTLQAIKEAHGQLARLNQDLAQHIEEIARDKDALGSAGFRLLRQDHKDLVYANLRKAQTEHEEAKERVRSLSNGSI